MKDFKIDFNRSVTPEQRELLFSNLLEPELSALRRVGIRCLSVVRWHGFWMIERNGASQTPHLDFYWLYGPGFTIETAEGVLHPAAGDFLIVPSWLDRRQTIVGDECRHIYLRSDKPEFFRQFQTVTMRKSLLGGEFLSDITRLVKSCNPLLPDERRYRVPLAELVAQQFFREVNFDPADGSGFREKIFHCLSHASGRLTVPELAKMCCLSESSLYKRCVEHFDSTPSRLLAEYRLNNAGNYLLSGAYSIKEVARLTGYSDEFSFSKAFRRFFGVPPSVYAAAKLEKEEEK